MITPIYAALLVFLYILLSFRIIKLRVSYQIGLGDGEHPLLTRAIRAHGNFTEYVPFALLLIWMYETMHGAPILVHVMGMLLFAGRALHAYGVSQKEETLLFRQSGMIMTFVVLVMSAVLILAKTVFTSAF